MFLGLLLSGAMLYTSANLIAYDEVVDRVKNQQEKNKERKGFKKGLVGLGNTLAKVTFFPAFISKNVVNKSLERKNKNLNNKDSLETKIRNLGKEKEYSEERIEKIIEIAKSKEADKSEKLSTDELVKYSDDLVSEYISSVNKVQELEKNAQSLCDNNELYSRIDKDYYALENETEISKAILRRSLDMISGKAEKINISDNFSMIKDYSDMQFSILAINEMYQEVKEDIDFYNDQIALRINKKYEDTKKEMEKLGADESALNTSEKECDIKIDALNVIKTELTNKGLDEVKKHFEEQIIDAVNEMNDINQEVCNIIKGYNSKETPELKLISFENNVGLAETLILANNKNPEDELEKLEDLVIQFNENKNKINYNDYYLSVCYVVEDDLKEYENEENFDASSKTEEIVDEYIKSISNLKAKKEELAPYVKELEAINRDKECFTLTGASNEIESFGHYVLKGMVTKYFDKESEDYNNLIEKVLECVKTPFESSYDLEISCQEEIAEKLALKENISKEEAIKTIQNDFFTDLKLEQKEEKEVELEEVIEEIEKPEEIKEEVIETEVEEIKEEVNEPKLDEEKPIAEDLTGNGRKAIKTSPVTKVYRKVNYCKYHTLDLTEAEYNKLTEKQKYVYNLVNEYGKDGLPVGIFTALGVKMTQAKKVISPVGDKFEKDYNEEEASKVLKIVNEKLNNDLYLATNGNEKIKVVRYPIKSINVTKTRVEVIDDISSKYKVCLVKGLTAEQTEALKAKFGDKINIYNNYIIYSTKEKNIAKETEKVLSKA